MTGSPAEPAPEEHVPLTDVQRRALIADRGTWRSLLGTLALCFVGGLILSVPIVFYKGRALRDCLPIAVIFTILMLGLALWNRRDAQRDLKGGFAIRCTGPMAFDAPDQKQLRVAARKVWITEDERPALAAILPCHGAVDVALHADLIFEIRDEAGRVIYTGPEVREVRG